MTNDKFILFTTPRSGSSYICLLLQYYFATKKINYLSVNSEIANKVQWQINDQDIINENIQVIKDLRLDYFKIDSTFMNTIFLYYLTRPESYIFKYFVFDAVHTDVDEIIAVSEKYNIKIICLYRKNILDFLLSRLIKENLLDKIYNRYEYTENNILIDHFIKEDVIHTYQLYLDIFNKFNEHSSIYKVISYEDIAFEPNIDIDLFYQNAKLENTVLSKKEVDIDLKQTVLRQHPDLIDCLTDHLSKSNLPVVNDYYFCLNY
jgi:hypothetical protein